MSDEHGGSAENRVGRTIRGLLGAAVVVLMTIIVVSISIQIGSRFIGPRTVGWTEEVARYATIWLTFVGSILVMSRDQHIAMDALVARTRGWLRVGLEVVAKLLVVGTCLALLPAGVAFVLSRGYTRSPALGIPISWVYAGAIIGFAGMAIYASIWLVRTIRIGPRPLENPDEEILT